MSVSPTPGSISGRRVDKAGDPLDGLINLFDLSLVLAVGLLLAALSSINAVGLISPASNPGTPLTAQPPTAGQTSSGAGQEVGKVYRLSNGQYVFSPSAGSTVAPGGAGATSSTGGQTGQGASTPTGAIPPITRTPNQPNQTTQPPATGNPVGP